MIMSRLQLVENIYSYHYDKVDILFHTKGREEDCNGREAKELISF